MLARWCFTWTALNRPARIHLRDATSIIPVSLVDFRAEERHACGGSRRISQGGVGENYRNPLRQGSRRQTQRATSQRSCPRTRSRASRRPLEIGKSAFAPVERVDIETEGGQRQSVTADVFRDRAHGARLFHRLFARRRPRRPRVSTSQACLPETSRFRSNVDEPCPCAPSQLSQF